MVIIAINALILSVINFLNCDS